ncbi:MAG: ABC transporter ATP-binding protein [Myxococcota bacterium]
MILVESFGKTFKTSAFKAPSVAARDISLEVEAGEIHGFLGPNGAGKSTTIKALLGLIRPDRGRVELFGQPVAEGGWRTRVGYMPEQPNFYDYLTGKEMVAWFGRLAGLTRSEADQEAQRQLERVGLGHAMDRRIRTYSKGMIQRAGLAQALLGSPDLLILDEPMTGLDPIGRREIRDLILSIKDEGKTVFYSTHILPDIEMTCDRVTMVHKGRTLRAGRLDDILTETSRGVTVSLAELSDERTRELLEAHGADASRGQDHLTLELKDVEAASALASQLVREDGARILRFEPHRDDLETIFVRSLEDESPDATTEAAAS